MDSPDCYEVTTRTKAKAGYNWWIQPTTFGGKNIISPFIHSKNEAFAWQKRYQNVSFCFKGKIKSRCGSASEVKLKTSTPTPKSDPSLPPPLLTFMKMEGVCQWFSLVFFLENLYLLIFQQRTSTSHVINFFFQSEGC